MLAASMILTAKNPATQGRCFLIGVAFYFCMSKRVLRQLNTSKAIARFQGAMIHFFSCREQFSTVYIQKEMIRNVHS